MKDRITLRASIIVFAFTFASCSHAAEQQQSCLDGFDLTAIVVLETDIRQSVQAYACRMTFPQDSSTYKLYNQLRDKWTSQRLKQKKRRDDVYQRIYADAWQDKVDGWRQTMAVNYSKDFEPTDIACQDLRMEMVAQAHDWKTLYNAAAREAASARYDSLRCGMQDTINIGQ